MSRVNQAEVARRLGVNRSTVKRWLDKHPALMDEDGLVDVDQFRAHRDAVANPGNQTRTKSAKTDPRSSEPLSGLPSLNDHRARSAAAAAMGAELDLAARLKMTLLREEVEVAAADAGEVLKQTAAQLARDKAEVLALIDDPRAMERAIQDMMDELLSKAARELRSIAQEQDSESAA